MVPAQTPKKILIAGGGIAGMETARVATIRGHKVSLYEKSGELGGHVIPGSKPDFKLDDRRLLEWYKNQMSELKIDVHMNTEVTKELAESEKPDAIVVAAGSYDNCIPVPGIDKPQVKTATDILNNISNAGEQVVVIGGGLVGCETALFLAKAKKDVTVVEMLDDILLSSGNPIPHMNRMMLIDLLKFYQVKVITSSSLLEVKDSSVVIIDKRFRKKELSCNTVVTATGYRKDDALYTELNGEFAEIYVVGDANKADNIMHAIWTANEIGLRI
jgi:2-enoate reductase